MRIEIKGADKSKNKKRVEAKMASTYNFNMFGSLFMVSSPSVSGTTSFSPCEGQNIDLLSELHQQVDRWMNNCSEIWVDQDVIEDLTMIKIMIEGWMNSNPSQSLNG